MNDNTPKWAANKEHAFETNADGVSSQKPVLEPVQELAQEPMRKLIIETTYASPERFYNRMQTYIGFLNNGCSDK